MHWIPDSALAPTLFPSELSTTESSAFICQLFTPESGNQIGFCLLHWPLALEQPPWRYSCFCSVLPQPVLPAARRGIYLKCITGCLWFPDWNSLHFFFYILVLLISGRKGTLSLCFLPRYSTVPLHSIQLMVTTQLLHKSQTKKSIPFYVMQFFGFDALLWDSF